MIGLVAAVIAIALVIFVLVGIAMFFDVAMGRGERVVAERETESRRWSPPFIRGRELSGWAQSLATGIVGDVVEREAPADAPAAITSQLNRGAAGAMLPGIRPGEALRTVPCPEAGQGAIGISAPEVIHLASYLRRRLASGELRDLRDESERNAALLAEGSSNGFAATPCSLQGDDCVCVAYADRPMACRPLHAAILAEELDLHLTTGANGTSPNGGASPMAAHMEAIGQGVSEGLAHGLEAAGLDANRYELHSALVTALDAPDAAERFAAGEDVFAGCRLVQAEQGPGPQLLR